MATRLCVNADKSSAGTRSFVHLGARFTPRCLPPEIKQIHPSDLMEEPFHFFYLEGPAAVRARPAPAPPVPPPSDDRPGAGALLSITSAWNNFIAPSPAPAAPLAVPAASLTDKAVRVAFRYPPTASPPPRLAAFALPSWVVPDVAERPRDSCFCLTGDQYAGGRLFGFVLQLCEHLPVASPGGQGAEDVGTRLQLSALVLLTPWPTYELCKTLLRFIFSQRELMWPHEGPASPGKPTASASAAGDRPQQLMALLERAATALHQSRQELEWLSAHPLWLPTPLAPLFRGLRWEAVDVAYLLAAVLTDQKVILHSSSTDKLYCASCALRALITPLEYPAVYIPLLPPHLMELDSVPSAAPRAVSAVSSASADCVVGAVSAVSAVSAITTAVQPASAE